MSQHGEQSEQPTAPTGPTYGESYKKYMAAITQGLVEKRNESTKDDRPKVNHDRRTINMTLKVAAAVDHVSTLEGTNGTDAANKAMAVGALVIALLNDGHRLQVIDGSTGNTHEIIMPY